MREAIVINKLALEYRKMKAEEGGVVLASSMNLSKTPLDQTMLEESKNGRARQKHLQRRDKDQMQIGVKNSKTMLTHFRVQSNI